MKLIFMILLISTLYANDINFFLSAAIVLIAMAL